MKTRRIEISEDQRLYRVDQVAATVELISDLRGHLIGVHHGGRVVQPEEKLTLERVDAILSMLTGE